MRVTLRAVPWLAIAVVSGTGLLLSAGAVAAADFWFGPLLVSFGLALFGAAAAFALDEPAAAVVDAVPQSLRHRTAVRAVALAVPFLAGVAALAALEAGGRPVHIAWLLLHLAGCLVVGFACAAVGRRRSPTPGETAASAVGVSFMVLACFEPLARWVVVFPAPADDRSGRSALLWCGLLVASAVTIARATRDPSPTDRIPWPGSTCGIAIRHVGIGTRPGVESGVRRVEALDLQRPDSAPP